MQFPMFIFTVHGVCFKLGDHCDAFDC